MSLRKILASSLIAFSIASCSGNDNIRLKKANEVAEYCSVYKYSKNMEEECTKVKSNPNLVYKNLEFRNSY